MRHIMTVLRCLILAVFSLFFITTANASDLNSTNMVLSSSIDADTIATGNGDQYAKIRWIGQGDENEFRLDTKGGTGFGTGSGLGGNNSLPKAEHEYKCPDNYKACPSCGYGVGASCNGLYSRCRHQNKFKWNEENCEASDALKLEKPCTIEDVTKHEECNCTIEEENSCRTVEYKCVERKCRNSVCSKFECAVPAASKPSPRSCECGGGGVSCSKQACTNPKCGNSVCVEWSVAECSACPPKEGEPGGPPCSATCTEGSPSNSCGGYVAAAVATATNEAGTCSITCYTCTNTPKACPAGSSTSQNCTGNRTPVPAGQSGNETCYACEDPCSDCRCGSPYNGTVYGPGCSNHTVCDLASGSRCSSDCNKYCGYTPGSGTCNCCPAKDTACAGKTGQHSTTCGTNCVCNYTC